MSGAAAVQAARDAADSFTVKYRDFLVRASRSAGAYVFAFEGNDHYYYDARIRTLITDFPTIHVHMGGRKNVLKLLEMHDKNTSMQAIKAAYLVDNDYITPEVQDSRLYVTPAYSIENFYVSDQAVRRTVSTLFGLRETVRRGNDFVQNTELQNVTSFICETLKSYEDELGMPLNAFIHAATISNQNKEKNHGLATKNFDQHEFSSFYEIGVSGFKLLRQPDYATLLDAFKVEPNVVPQNQFEESKNIMKSLNLRKFGRGKFIFRVLLDILRVLEVDARKTRPKIFGERHAQTIPISGTAELALLSAFADTPPCLNPYLTSLVAKYATPSASIDDKKIAGPQIKLPYEVFFSMIRKTISQIQKKFTRFSS